MPRKQSQIANEVRFEVAGSPVPQPRHRVGGKGAYIPDDHPIHAYKHRVNLMARQARPSGWGLDGWMEVDVLFLMPRMKNKEFEAGPIGRRWHGDSCDVDNIFKGCADALKGIIWNDDKQIVDARMIKVYARVGEEPKTVVRVRRKSEEVPGLEIEI